MNVSINGVELTDAEVDNYLSIYPQFKPSTILPVLAAVKKQRGHLDVATVAHFVQDEGRGRLFDNETIEHIAELCRAQLGEQQYGTPSERELEDHWNQMAPRHQESSLAEIGFPSMAPVTELWEDLEEAVRVPLRPVIGRLWHDWKEMTRRETPDEWKQT